jgi:DHA2 family multidrug resistance protein
VHTGILIFIRQTRNVHREPFDFVGFFTLSLGIGALQLMLDRGELKDWFNSSEIWIEATVAGLGFYLFTVHTVTTDERSFLNRDLLKSANFVAGTLLMFCGGLIMTGTLALLPTMLQNLMNYPALTTGMVTMPRGIGSMAAMFLVAPLINGLDNRLIILFGLLLTALSMWQMSQFSLQMGMTPVIISGLLQGFGLGCTQLPPNIIALSTLPSHILTQGTAIRSLMRNLGGSHVEAAKGWSICRLRCGLTPNFFNLNDCGTNTYREQVGGDRKSRMKSDFDAAAGL